ncbi:MAG: antibiotic biosynthesis monooxygenase [Chloroflexota bacterium]
MIVRVFTGRVAIRREGDFNQRLRPRLAEIRAAHGNRYAKFARKIDGDRERVILITEWASAADLYDWAGPRVDEPRFVDLSLLDEWQVEHWEALDIDPEREGASELPPPDGGGGSGS